MTTVLANGCFDMFHPGHMHLLKHAMKLGDRLIVAVNGDGYIHAKKARKPLVPLQNRMDFIKMIKGVDEVYSFAGETELYDLIRDLKVDIIVKGDDWEGNRVTGSDIATVAYVPLLPGYSTTKMIEKAKGC